MLRSRVDGCLSTGFVALLALLALAAPVLAQDAPPPSPVPGVDEIVFVTRPLAADPHWYANFSYYAFDDTYKAYKDGAQLRRLNLATGKESILLADPTGGIRDPQVHYDGTRIVFSYRKGGTPNYLLYEISVDGTGLRQLTDGIYDDIEPTYVPDGGIVFCSSRCKRWVNCWLTQVAVLYRCDADGGNIRPISSNNEHDNTPWPLPDGRILYQRWEYVDRSQVHYHHLWTTNPDGTNQMVYYGNFHPGILMIDAKPIPNSEKVVALFSPGHGRREHDGVVTIVTPKAGPDEKGSARTLHEKPWFRDPYPLSEDCILAAQHKLIIAMDGTGKTRELYKLPADLAEAGYQCHAPRPLLARPRERVIASTVDLEKPTGHLILSDVYTGRRMDGVARGDVKKLLVLESLPMPIHYEGGMRPITQGGSFTLERVVGTVPVEPDGSAYMELPALRSFFFVALDENNDSVKRMQSFLTVQPGETMSCVGCHEHRTLAPQNRGRMALQALNRPPSPIQPLEGIPEVYDFPRDIQPILDKHCLKCHSHDARKGGVILSGHRGPIFTHSYYTLNARRQMADGRNQPVSDRAPRTIGAVASPLMKKLDGAHHDVKLSPHEKDVIRYWLEAGATYPGTYAALRSGMIGHTTSDRANGHKPYRDVTDRQWPASAAAAEAINRRCGSCHQKGKSLPRYLSEDRAGRFSCHLVFDLTDPANSTIVRAPLAKEAGGLGICGPKAQEGKPPPSAPVFGDTADPDYQAILALCVAGKQHIEAITRFDMPGFRPLPSYTREMKRYGVLPPDLASDVPIDPYATDDTYWRSLWWQPQAEGS
jgi:Hydrazine synthase alpha subunit middle domain